MTRPASFFETESRDPSLRRPAVVVGLVGVAGLLATIPTTFAAFDALPERAGLFAAVGFAIGGVSSLLGPFVSWLVVGSALLAGSLAVGGDGDVRDLFALVGWGFAPRVVVPVVGGIVSFAVVSGTDFSDPQQVQQAAELSTGTLGIVTQGIDAAAFLWAGWMWTHALASARQITTRNAAVIVGIVVLLQVLVNVGLTLLSAALV